MGSVESVVELSFAKAAPNLRPDSPPGRAVASVPVVGAGAFRRTGAHLHTLASGGVWPGSNRHCTSQLPPGIALRSLIGKITCCRAWASFGHVCVLAIRKIGRLA